MKAFVALALTVVVLYSLYHFFLGLMHLESVLFTGSSLFVCLLTTVRLLTWQRGR
ncbi:MAG: hypothetical protein ABF608_01520 [Sporolactobacillus sp.]